MARNTFRWQIFALTLVVMGGLSLITPLPSKAQTDERCFTETNQCIKGRFREFWEQNGNIPVFGFPISAAKVEVDQETGKTYEVQWFERNRFELHPENSAPYDVLLGRLGDSVLLKKGIEWKNVPSEKLKPNCLWFKETNRLICDEEQDRGFKTYWLTHGLVDPNLADYDRSLALFGLPLTDAKVEISAADGKPYLTQWFERARFEWHPEKSEEYRVLLGLLGQETQQPSAGPTSGPISPTAPTVLPSPTLPPLSPPEIPPSITPESTKVISATVTPTTIISPAEAPVLPSITLEATKVISATATPTTNISPTATLPKATPTPLPRAADPFPKRWFERLNAYRQAAATAPITEDAQLSAAAAKHVSYMLLNLDEFDRVENPALPGYTPEGNEAASQGILWRGINTYTEKDVLDTWMESALHRYGLLRHELTRTGFAMACDGENCAAALNIIAGLTGPNKPEGIIYPGNEQRNVRTKIITWQFSSAEPKVTVVDAAIHDQHGNTVAFDLEPATDDWNIITLKPQDDLEAGMTYFVDIHATQNGQPIEKHWGFVTR